jgi:hypothetical protein
LPKIYLTQALILTTFCENKIPCFFIRNFFVEKFFFSKARFWAIDEDNWAVFFGRNVLGHFLNGFSSLQEKNWRLGKNRPSLPLKKLTSGHAGPRNKNSESNSMDQGCQMVYFQTENPNLGKF